MIRRPYVGITGFMSVHEVREIVALLPGEPRDWRHLMVGVLASSKTIAGKTNKHPHRYPLFHGIEDIFLNDPCVLNIVHYNTKELLDTLCDQMCRVIDIAGPHCDGLQLNIPWPPVEALRSFKKSSEYGINEIILQVGSSALNSAENDPKKLRDKLKEYIGAADYVLLDPSGGMGRLFDAEVMKGYLNALYDVSLQYYFGIGIAGGINQDNVEEILRQFIPDFPDLNIDAESGVRDEDDHLDLEKVQQYVTRAFHFLENVPRQSLLKHGQLR